MSSVRQAFAAELEQLRLQVELMAIRVDQNLERMREVLRTGDADLAQRAINADDDIDGMHVSLMERCYDLLRREAPVASDLRFVVSVLRMAMADEAIERYRLALRAWATMDLGLATDLATRSRTMDLFYERLMGEVLRFEGPEATRAAVVTVAVGRAIERIGDHAGIIGARLRYLITGDPDHLAAEVR